VASFSGMLIDPATGLAANLRQVLSPFRDARPNAAHAELIIVHGISLPPGRFGGPEIDQLFTGSLDPAGHPFFAETSKLRVSSHAFIRRGGEIIQYVPFHERAWHAGVSHYRGRSGCNDFSIGIELEGTDSLPYEDAQYAALARLIRALLTVYPALSRDRIVGHSDVAPGRKTDPGPHFDWPRLKALLA
jgi:AmpD protein